MATKKTAAAPVDEGLEQIGDLERRINLAFEENGRFHQIMETELCRLRGGVQAQAKAVCDRLREEYLVRQRFVVGREPALGRTVL